MVIAQQKLPGSISNNKLEINALGSKGYGHAF